jgi:hypothetical protein
MSFSDNFNSKTVNASKYYINGKEIDFDSLLTSSNHWVKNASGHLHLNNNIDLIGIGTTEPSYNLHVNGNGTIVDLDIKNNLTVEGNSTVEGDSTVDGNSNLNGNLTVTNSDVRVTNFIRNPSTINELSYVRKYERGDSPSRYIGIVATNANGNIIVVGNSNFDTQDIRINIVEYSNGNYETLQDISPFSGEGDTYAGNSSVAVNDDGTRFIVGNVDGEGAYQSYTGAFKIYERNGNQYTELIEVTGTSSGDYLGSVVDMNSKGDIVATLIPGQGQIKVYRQSGNSWYNYPIDISMLQSTYVYNDLGLGTSPDPNTRSFALSNDGNRLVTNSKNYIYVYDWNGTAYSSQASITSPSLVGTDATTYVSFDFNGDGTMFVVGFAGASDDDGDVFVYELNNGTWSLRYNNMRLSGDRSNARFGFSVSMSNDGNSLAIGTQGMKGSEGYVKLYHWDSSTSTYTEKQRYPGSEHTLGRTDTAYGYSVSLSKYGNTLVIGELKSYYTPVPSIENGGLFIFRDLTVGNELFISNGKIGIGTDNPVGNLTVKSQNRQISIIDSGTNNNYSEIRAHANSNLNSKAYLQITSYALGLNTNNKDNAISIDSNGQTIISNLTSNSDDRIKHNEKEISNPLSVISKLKPKHYFKTSGLYDANHNFKLDISGNPIDNSGNKLVINKDYTLETGIIAQEIINIPELNFTVKENNEQENLPLSVDYNSIFCTHIAATQELNNKVISLQNQLESVLKRLDNLESN